MSAALNKLLASENDAREFGFEWPTQKMIVEWIVSEGQEVLDAIRDQESPARVQEEIGDLLHAAISLCLFSGFDVEDTMDKTASKFDLRMHWLKTICKQRGLDTLRGESVEFMLELWREAKIASKQPA